MASSQSQLLNGSSNASQATTVVTESDRVFTPPASDSETSIGHGVGNHPSSQDSQLLQLSQLAAAQEKMAEVDDGASNGVQSRKRMADGEVKHTRGEPGISPVRRGHSRNTSTVSVASTTSSRIGEVGCLSLSRSRSWSRSRLYTDVQITNLRAAVCRAQSKVVLCYG